MVSDCLTAVPQEEYLSNTEPILSHTNIGSGREIAIEDLSILMKKVTEFEGEICFDTTKPDGPPRKLLDSSKLSAMGWQPSIDLEKGLVQTYDHFISNYSRQTFRS